MPGFGRKRCRKFYSLEETLAIINGDVDPLCIDNTIIEEGKHTSINFQD